MRKPPDEANARGRRERRIPPFAKRAVFGDGRPLKMVFAAAGETRGIGFATGASRRPRQHRRAPRYGDA